MFWGLNLKPNRKYSQTATKAFHISSAALDGTSSKGGPTQIYISSESEKFLVCTLQKEGPLQVMLDLNFGQGEDICFQSVGSGNVSLTGYVNEDYDFGYGEEEGDDEEGSMDEQEMADLRNALNAKRQKKGKKAEENAKEAEDDDSESDDPDFNGVVDDEAEEDDEDDDDDDDDSDELGEEEEVGDDEDDEDIEEDDEDGEDDEEEGDFSMEEVEPESKKAKLDKPEKLQNGKVASKNQKEQKKENQQQQQQGQQKQQEKKQQQNKKNDSGSSSVGVEKTISGGVKIIDIREGNGPEAKPGKKAQVYYEGRLKSNNKVFDSMKKGAGFKFSLGAGEVIKGWDLGVAGMKVGGKRRITCPPHMAYGNKGAPPAIPPNSTLVFEVELKGVN